MALVGGQLALRQLLLHWGFTEEHAGYRYYRKDTIDNKLKEIVVTIPTPANVIMRQVFRWGGNWGPDPGERMQEVFDKAHWDLHPIWKLAYEVFTNRGRGGEEIYHYWDMPSDKQKAAYDIAKYSFNRLFTLLGEIEASTGKERTEALSRMKEDLGDFNAWFLKATTMMYTRQPAEIRYTRKLYELQREFNRALLRNVEGLTPEQQTRWINNLKTRMDAIMKHMEERKESRRK